MTYNRYWSIATLLLCACAAPSERADASTQDAVATDSAEAEDALVADVVATDGGSDGGRCEGPTQLRVVTFNSGTTSAEASAGHPDGYGSEQADISDEYYGNGLSWLPAVDATKAWLSAAQPDIIVFQELFHSPLCADIPPDAQAGYICERWSEGDPTVVNEILGPGYQVACNLGKPDKCAAVRYDVGSFRGCDSDLCLDGLDGGRVPDCGGGSRIGRGVIDLVCGGEVTVVSVHGTSGFGDEDQGCRVQQLSQIFDDLLDGSGEGAANGARNIIMGDFNTDPGRAAEFDDSAARLERYLAETDFRAVSPKGADAPGSYATAFDIDYVLSDVFDGPCEFAGLQNEAVVYEHGYFDHYPLVCDLVDQE